MEFCPKKNNFSYKFNFEFKKNIITTSGKKNISYNYFICVL